MEVNSMDPETNDPWQEIYFVSAANREARASIFEPTHIRALFTESLCQQKSLPFLFHLRQLAKIIFPELVCRWYNAEIMQEDVHKYISIYIFYSSTFQTKNRDDSPPMKMSGCNYLKIQIFFPKSDYSLCSRYACLSGLSSLTHTHTHASAAEMAKRPWPNKMLNLSLNDFNARH